MNVFRRPLFGAAADAELSKPYRFTTTPPAADWMSEAMDDGGWASGLAPFGNALPGVRTSWTNADIWLRQSFDSQTGDIQAASLVIFHDEDAEVYVNGQFVWKQGGYTMAYEAFGVTEESAAERPQHFSCSHPPNLGRPIHRSSPPMRTVSSQNRRIAGQLIAGRREIRGASSVSA